MTTTELTEWERAHAQLPSEARERFDVEQVRVIRKTVAPKLDAAEFQMFMSLAAKYDLDPLAKEIWGSKSEARDGREGRVLIMVGRDGLLRVARRDRTYAGFDSDVVREKDTFRVRRSKDGREVIHEYEGGPEARGKIIGAWAQVYQKGYHETYFFAPWVEYAPRSMSKAPTWDKQPSVMIQKCALSLCLRLAFNLSGVVGEEEAARVFEEDEPREEVSLSEVAEEVPAELRDRFYAAYGDAADLRPGVLTSAAVQMSVRGQSPERVEEWLAGVEAANDRAREARDADAPVEADVVEEPPDVEALRARLSDLLDRRTEVEENPGQHGETEGALALVDEEIEDVERSLRSAGAEVPGQEAMDV